MLTERCPAANYTGKEVPNLVKVPDNHDEWTIDHNLPSILARLIVSLQGPYGPLLYAHTAVHISLYERRVVLLIAPKDLNSEIPTRIWHIRNGEMPSRDSRERLKHLPEGYHQPKLFFLKFKRLNRYV